jgi:hypothetical protein
MGRWANPCYLPGHNEAGMAKSKRRFGHGVRRPSPVDVHAAAMTPTQIGLNAGNNSTVARQPSIR